MSRAPRTTIRWWPAVSILVLYGLAELWVWVRPDEIRQTRVIHTFIVTFVGVVILLLWFLFFSRAARRWRWLALGMVVAVVLFFRFFVSIRGVTGDLVPILGWKRGGETAVSDRVALTGPVEDAAAVGFPQFLGPQRNATVPGVELGRDWQAEPPRQVWRREVGEAWSGFAVMGNHAVTQEQRGDDELVVAYDLATGEESWSARFDERYETTIGGVGPRATPTIADGRVYSLGATGLLSAIDLESGEVFWSRDILAEHGATNPEWGKSCSPLVLDGLVVVSAGGAAGGSLVAYDATSGELKWKAGNDRSSYSSPVVASLLGRRQILIMNQASLAGHDPASGELLWSHPWPAEQPNVAVPLVLSPSRVLASSGYGIGSKVLELSDGPDGLVATLVWESPRLKAKFTNLVRYEGYVYGLDDGIMVCLDPATGKRCWKSGRYGHGQVLLVDDLLLVTTEKGDVVLLEPTPEEHRELGRFNAFSAKTWNPPALVGNHLLVRSATEAALYELPSG